MGIRTGAQYLQALRDDREIWHRGKRVKDVTTEPGLCRGPRTLAEFLDRQQNPAHINELTFSENQSSDRYAMSFPCAARAWWNCGFNSVWVSTQS